MSTNYIESTPVDAGIYIGVSDSLLYVIYVSSGLGASDETINAMTTLQGGPRLPPTETSPIASLRTVDPPKSKFMRQKRPFPGELRRILDKTPRSYGKPTGEPQEKVYSKCQSSGAHICFIAQ